MTYIIASRVLAVLSHLRTKTVDKDILAATMREYATLSTEQKKFVNDALKQIDYHHQRKLANYIEYKRRKAEGLPLTHKKKRKPKSKKPNVKPVLHCRASPALT
jgi:Arc/MetJ family transcription regulator